MLAMETAMAIFLYYREVLVSAHIFEHKDELVVVDYRKKCVSHVKNLQMS